MCKIWVQFIKTFNLLLVSIFFLIQLWLFSNNRVKKNSFYLTNLFHNFLKFYHLPRIFEIAELCISGQAFRIFRRSSLAHTIKAFIGLLIWGLPSPPSLRDWRIILAPNILAAMIKQAILKLLSTLEILRKLCEMKLYIIANLLAMYLKLKCHIYVHYYWHSIDTLVT